MTMKAFIKEALITLLMALVLYFGLQFTIQGSPVEGTSMEPTLTTGQRLFINRVVYYFESPQRGDIITFYPPVKSSRPYVKRIIGLPGETVEIDQGTVYIDGEPLEEPYVEYAFTYSMDAITIPADRYLVLGDNRNVSSDSHIWGLITRDEIIGKAWISYWPPSTWGTAPNYDFSN
jgi:signal peptidase I